MAVPGFNDKPGEHSDAGAVKEIQFPEVKHNRHGRIDQGFLEHLENGRVILRAAQAQRAFEEDGGVVVLQPDLK